MNTYSRWGGECEEGGSVRRRRGAGVSEWGDGFGGFDWIFFSVPPIQFELF